MTQELVTIDGAQGEGGGQIVRTSLALACVTGKPVRINNIRAGRPKPGLAAQHLSCVRAACAISTGHCRGDQIGSRSLEFWPTTVAGGSYRFDIGTAGACSLVAQTVLPALFLAPRPSEIALTGGTHNPWAPPFDFLEKTFLPRLGDFGLKADTKLTKYGFYPAGGGILNVAVYSSSKTRLSTVNLTEPCQVRQINCFIYTSQLPLRIADLQRQLLLDSALPIDNVRHIEINNADSPGNCVIAEVERGRHTSVFSAFGRKGKPSRQVVAELVQLTSRFIASEAAVDGILADQLLLYMALAGGGCITTEIISPHCRTNIEVIKSFFPLEFLVTEKQKAWEIICVGRNQMSKPEKINSAKT